jgi:hypothetical protein
MAFVKSIKLASWYARSAVGTFLLAIVRRLRPDLFPQAGPDHVWWPNITASHYQAVSEFAHALERLQAKRYWLQERRRVADRDLVPLFGDPFFANYADQRYLDFYRWITRVQGLRDRFSASLD